MPSKFALAWSGRKLAHRIRVLECDPRCIDRINVLDEPMSGKFDRCREIVRSVDRGQPVCGQDHGELSLSGDSAPDQSAPEEPPGLPGKLLPLEGTVRRRAALLTTGVRHDNTVGSHASCQTADQLTWGFLGRVAKYCDPSVSPDVSLVARSVGRRLPGSGEATDLGLVTSSVRRCPHTADIHHCEGSVQ